MLKKIIPISTFESIGSPKTSKMPSRISSDETAPLLPMMISKKTLQPGYISKIIIVLTIVLLTGIIAFGAGYYAGSKTDKIDQTSPLKCPSTRIKGHPIRQDDVLKRPSWAPHIIRKDDVLKRPSWASDIIRKSGKKFFYRKLKSSIKRIKD